MYKSQYPGTLKKLSATGYSNRPQWFTWLCVVSFISGILWIVMYIALMVISYKGNVSNKLFPGIVVEYARLGYSFMITEVLLAGVALYGVFLMWKLKRPGFYLYSISKAAIYFLPALYIGAQKLEIVSLGATSIMIILYGCNIQRK